MLVFQQDFAKLIIGWHQNVKTKPITLRMPKMCLEWRNPFKHGTKPLDPFQMKQLDPGTYYNVENKQNDVVLLIETMTFDQANRHAI